MNKQCERCRSSSFNTRLSGNGCDFCLGVLDKAYDRDPVPPVVFYSGGPNETQRLAPVRNDKQQPRRVK